ncbi:MULTISPECIES: RNA-binding cell elongation regulator Jag/EloR [Paenibacillus]|uniref:RNA-binding protein KhpB n=1 Tax=Paenibacillus naphthalenovorans TaxID=162209 RepID=A0A0U2L3V0_9BACL|nr:MULTISPECIES: RNA-binding cell elongation regulator Jag/EloR [Paenibacillus]ALS24578.1 DNA-binding protein [Paenibacillus naphthalenovorans]NTZ16040.1 protein jag [Paenibacillus sp. JMULE4]GCL74681.1 protein jag [Paenibacillus naphthalenovorans]SDJ43282.1 spoIIIJ-associated protein [Paenibacillus naphthalenovorans]
MTKKIVVTGKTIDEAVNNGLQQLGTTENRVHVNVLEQPAKGLFGLFGAKEAKVELTLLPDAIEEAVLFLEDVFRSMKLDVRIEQKQDKEVTELHLHGSELGMLIGRRGQTLDALQYLVNIVANRYSDRHLRIVLDAEQFRERRKKTLQELADRLADRVIRTRKEVVLEPMSPQERKIIHSQLQHHPKVRTFSRGDEPNRRVVIVLR